METAGGSIKTTESDSHQNHTPCRCPVRARMRPRVAIEAAQLSLRFMADVEKAPMRIGTEGPWAAGYKTTQASGR